MMNGIKSVFCPVRAPPLPGRRETRSERLERYRRTVTEAVEPGVVIARVGAARGGYDDEIVLALGGSTARVLLPLGYDDGTMLDQVADIVPTLKQREAERLAYETAVRETVARFYIEGGDDGQ